MDGNVNVLTREQLDAIGQGIADMSLRIDVAKHELLTQLRKFDAHDGWANSGFVSLPAWLAWRIDIGTVAAREYVRVARALGELKLVDAAFAAGKLSYSKVRTITRSATPETEQDFLDISTNATASQIERLSAAYRRIGVDPMGVPLDQRRFVRRSDTASGMVRIEAQLPPEQAAIVWEALSAALDAGRSQADASAESDASPPLTSDASAESRRAEFRPDPAERADALVSIAQAYLCHSPRTLGSGYELVLMSTNEQLEQGAAGIGGYLRDGTPIPLHVARMLACDCSRVDVEVGQSGEILDVGRARRTVPSAIGRALWLRDGGCRAPGCGRRHHLHAHHIEEWADGGKTALSNPARAEESSSLTCVLLCPGHHLQIHEGNLSVAVRDGKLEFHNRYGLKLEPVPERSDDFDAIERWLHTTEPGFDGAGTPVWDGSRLHLGLAIDSLLRSQASRDHARC